MTRSGLAMVMAALTLALGLGGLDRAAAEPWTMSEDGVVTRQDLHPNGPPPNPLRHVPTELLVKLRPGLPPAAAARALASVPWRSAKRFHAVEHLYHLKLAPGTNLHQAMRALRRHPDVQYAEPNFVVEAFSNAPNDPLFTSQWSLHIYAGIDAIEAWDITTGSAEVVVAVLDTGVDYLHVDLVDNLFRNEVECTANGWDDDGNGVVDDCHGLNALTGSGDPYDDHGHGTHVAGIIGATGNNASGVTGVAWTVRIMPCKFLDATGTGDTAGAIACLDYVLAMKQRGVKIVATNNSWGGGLFSQALADAIGAQRDNGILFVTAAGNAGGDNDTLRTYPCSYDVSNVVCVAATDENDALAPFSNYGRGTVHIAAPGVNILSTVPGNQYQTLSGTSMAAPHVTGTVALLYAADPAADWRTVFNRLLSGGEPTSDTLNTTVAGRRTQAWFALRCAPAPLVRRARPGASEVVGTGPLVLATYSMDCGRPYSQPSVTIAETGETLALRDDGSGADEAAGDGVFTTIWTPPYAGTFTLTFADGSVVTVHADPILKPGFPVQTWHGAGSYQSGQGLHVLVGNIDADPALEILVTGLAQGPLYAFKADGSAVPGWPVLNPPGAAYPALGQLTPGSSALDVVAGHFASQARLSAYSGGGTPLPGWPRPPANYMSSPPTTVDVDGDGVDEIFTDEQDWHLHAYRADATPATGWPTTGFIGGQERSMSAIADLDGDGRLDVITTSGSGSDGAYLFAYRHDGTLRPGFPVNFAGSVHTFPVVGDVDGDGVPEIIVTAGGGRVLIFSNTGVLKRTVQLQGTWFYSTAPALADLDGDGIPEIIVQTNSHLNVVKGDGSVLAGWPRALPANTTLGNASPVVGDVDGDGLPEIVTVVSGSGGAGYLLVYRRDGTLVPGFPRNIAGLGNGAVPAIADIDGDGRNDIIVASDYWNGTSGYYNKVWAFSLGGPTPHGPILWGQLMGGPKHQGRYGAAPAIVGSVLTITRAGQGSGTVTSSPIGINCGADCSERFVNGTVVTLTAQPSANSVFGGWSGACAVQANTCTVTVGAAMSVTATFDLGLTLTVAKTGAGAGVVTSSPAGIDCGSSCAAAYASGTVVTLTAQPSAGSVFSGWSGACAGQANTCTVTINAAMSVTARFDSPVTLTVSKNGAGAGGVTSSPAGIDCGSSCAAAFTSGTVVTLTAQSSAGAIFGGWSGACAGQSNPCTLTINAATSVTATFNVAFTLTVSKAGAGTGVVTSSPAGIDCGSTCAAAFTSGTVVTLWVLAGAETIFTGWSGACAGQSNPCTLTVSAATSATVTFDLVRYRLTVGAGGAATGVVTSSPPGIDCGSACITTYTSGTVVTLTATPGASAIFTGWTGDCSGQATTCAVTMTAPRVVTAMFDKLYTLSVSRAGSGDGTVTSTPTGITCGGDCTEGYVYATVVSLTATPAAGSVFAGWDSVCSGAPNPCSVTMYGAQSVTARFDRILYPLTTTITGQGSIISSPAGIACPGDCSEPYASGTTVTLTATAGSGYVFDTWSGCSGTGPVCAVTMDAAHTAAATFGAAQTLTISRTGSGTGTVTSSDGGINCGADCSEVYPRNRVVTLIAAPTNGATFQGWTGACSGTSPTCTLTMSANRSATAKFKR